MIAIARSFFAIVLPANITLSASINAASLFPNLSFIHDGGYKALFLALKSGDYNT